MKTQLLTRAAKWLWRAPISDIVLAAKGLLFLSIARFFILVVPFKQMARLLGGAKSADSCSKISVVQPTKVARLINRLSQMMPFRAMCFEKAIAMHLMQRLRGVKSTIYIGVKKDASGDLAAHAWLARNGEIVIGGENAKEYKPVAMLGYVAPKLIELPTEMTAGGSSAPLESDSGFLS